MSLGSVFYLRWLLVPFAATVAAGVVAWIVRIAATLLPRLFPNFGASTSADFFWNLVLVPGVESALLGFTFVLAGCRMAPSAKAKTAAVLSNVIVGVFGVLTLAVWLLEPTSVRSNLQATMGCIAAYIGARLAANSDLR